MFMRLFGIFTGPIRWTHPYSSSVWEGRSRCWGQGLADCWAALWRISWHWQSCWSLVCWSGVEWEKWTCGPSCHRKQNTDTLEVDLINTWGQVMYFVSAHVALETQAGHWGFMCHGDPGGGARVPQVILVDLPLSWSYHQAGTIEGEVHRGQQTVHPDGSQDTSVTHGQH